MTLQQLKSQAASQVAQYPQYDRHFEDCTLAVIKRRIRTKLGVAFERNETVLLFPPDPRDGVGYRTAWSMSNRVTTLVKENDIQPPTMYIVICRTDTDHTGQPGPYVLATRGVFTGSEDAHHYAKGIASSREAIVVEGHWDQLRFPWEPI